MTTISYPSAVRKWEKTKPLNHYTCDHHTESGVRISLPMYLDVPNTDRKTLLNAVRDVCSTSFTTKPANTRGITVVESQTMQPQVEAFLGMTIDVLRSVLFTRGGLSADLLFKLQAITGIELVTVKDLTAAFKARQAMVKTFVEETKFNEPEA